MSVTHVARTTRRIRDELLIACRGPASDASRLGPDLARILLCDAASVVVVFFNLAACVAH